MTENEAILEIRTMQKFNYTLADDEVFEMAIQALEEIQQYREMEEKLNGISVERVVNGFINTVEDRTEEPYERGRILTNTEADMWNEYRAIGTIEEFKALKECVYVDERPFIFICPNCKEIYTLEQDGRLSFCRKCNEKIDWDKIVFYQL